MSANPQVEPTQIRVIKAGDANVKPLSELRDQEARKVQVEMEAEAALTATKPRVEPSAKLVEVEPGLYEITVTCPCGEMTVVRCHSIPPES